MPRVGPLIAALKDTKSNVRSGAEYVLGSIKDPSAVVPLIEMLKDPDRGIRGGAAAALGEIGDARAVEPLVTELKDDAHTYREIVADVPWAQSKTRAQLGL